VPRSPLPLSPAASAAASAAAAAVVSVVAAKVGADGALRDKNAPYLAVAVPAGTAALPAKLLCGHIIGDRVETVCIVLEIIMPKKTDLLSCIGVCCRSIFE